MNLDVREDRRAPVVDGAPPERELTRGRLGVERADERAANTVAWPSIITGGAMAIGGAVVAAIAYAIVGGDSTAGFFAFMAIGLFVGLVAGSLVAGRLMLNRPEVSGPTYRGFGGRERAEIRGRGGNSPRRGLR